MTLANLKTKLKRVMLLILFLTALVILGSSGTIFPKAPLVTAQWKTDSPDNNHIGDIIQATLVITTQTGVSLDLTKAPNIGDVLPLPPKVDGSSPHHNYHYYDEYPPEIAEGELEVVSRQVTRHFEGGLVVTEIAYEFIYLLPLDLSEASDDKRLPWDVNIFQEYRQIFANTGRVVQESDKIFVGMTSFYIVPRVDENTRPILTLFELTPPATNWPKVRLAGFVSLGLAICLLAWQVASRLIAAHQRRQDQIALDPPGADELYQIWCQNPDQATFVEALKLYRRGVWGRPQASTWLTTTFILYSGVHLSLDQMKTVFARLVKEVSDEHTP